MSKPIDIIVAGHFDLDIIPKFLLDKPAENISQVLLPGKIVDIGEALAVPGGPVSNTGLSLKRFGINVELMGKVGNDRFGRTLLEIVQDCAPDTQFRGFKVSDQDSTSYVIAIIVPGIDRTFLVHSGAGSTFGEDDVDFDLVKDSRIFHFGYPPLMRKLYIDTGEELLKILRRAKELDVTTSLDLSLPDPESESGRQDWKAIMKRWAPYTDLMLPSVEEALFFLDRDKFFRVREEIGPHESLLDHLSPADIIPLGLQLLEFGPAVVMIKCGYHGLYIVTSDASRLERMGPGRPADLDNWANRQLWHPVYEVKNIVGALGSGDSAIAGFFAALINGHRIEDCLRYGNAAGSRNVTVSDGLSWNQGFDDLARRITGWGSDPLDIPEEGWHREAELWMGPLDQGGAA